MSEREEQSNRSERWNDDERDDRYHRYGGEERSRDRRYDRQPMRGSYPSSFGRDSGDDEPISSGGDYAPGRTRSGESRGYGYGSSDRETFGSRSGEGSSGRDYRGGEYRGGGSRYEQSEGHRRQGEERWPPMADYGSGGRSRGPGEERWPSMGRHGSGGQQRGYDEGYGEFSQGEWRQESDYGRAGYGRSRFGEQRSESGPRLTRYGRHESGEQSGSQGPHVGVGPKGYQRNPERLKEQVCDIFEEHGYLDASDIEVKVENSTIVLSGTVDSRRAKRLAEDLAESVNGVKDVDNRLKVKERDKTGSESETGFQMSGRSGSGSALKSSRSLGGTGTGHSES